MNTLERRNEIIRILNSQKIVTVAKLAQRLGVSERTISRDIIYLSSTVPLITTQGKNGGISLMEGYTYRDNKYYMSCNQLNVLNKIISQAYTSGMCNLSNEEIYCLEGIYEKYSKKV